MSSAVAAEPNELDIDDVRRLPLFEDLGEIAFQDLVTGAQMRHVRKNTAIFAEGHPSSSVHLLASGYAKMVQTTPQGAHVLLRYLGHGELFGLCAMRRSAQRSADVVTVSDAIELQWSARAMRELVARHPEIALSVIRVLEKRLRTAERSLSELSNEPVEQRIARALLRLANELGRPVGNLVEVPFALSRQDVADMTGSTLHTVSRVYRGWREKGLVEAGRQRLAIADMSRLASLAEGNKSGHVSPRRTHRRASSLG